MVPDRIISGGRIVVCGDAEIVLSVTACHKTTQCNRQNVWKIFLVLGYGLISIIHLKMK